VLGASAGVVGMRAASEQRRLRLRFVPVRAHWVQAGVHLGLYGAWASHWPEVLHHGPHLLAQILFYYGFDVLLAWWRRDEVRTGFGPIPIVGSVNLFLWFRDDWFVWQFGLLAVGALAKELVAWKREGRRAHVFNPSSFPLFFACMILWLGGLDATTWAGDIATNLGKTPHVWLWIFLLGLVVQSLFAVTLVTLSAVATLAVLNVAYTAATGVYAWVDVGIPAAVFLGCHFLVTDPATSPRTTRGRLLFGTLYGASALALYLLLVETGGPAYYDKLLFVPFLNLAVRRLDGLGGGRPGRGANLGHVAVGVALFGALAATGMVGKRHPGRDVSFWEEACREGRYRACRSWVDLLDSRCHDGEWVRCREFAGLLAAGDHVARDLPDAGYHLTLACQEGVAASCEEIPAFLAADGEAALRADCAAGASLSCLVLGSLGTQGMGSEENRSLAAARVERACELGLQEACAWLRR